MEKMANNYYLHGSLILWFNENRLKLGKFILLFPDVITKQNNKITDLPEDGKQLSLMQGLENHAIFLCYVIMKKVLKFGEYLPPCFRCKDH